MDTRPYRGWDDLRAMRSVCSARLLASPGRAAAHPELHRRGFGRALLLDGLRRFAADGMTYAIVGVDVDNPGAEALYRSVGFRPDRVLRGYERL